MRAACTNKQNSRLQNLLQKLTVTLPDRRWSRSCDVVLKNETYYRYTSRVHYSNTLERKLARWAERSSLEITSGKGKIRAVLRPIETITNLFACARSPTCPLVPYRRSGIISTTHEWAAGPGTMKYKRAKYIRRINIRILFAPEKLPRMCYWYSAHARMHLGVCVCVCAPVYLISDHSDVWDTNTRIFFLMASNTRPSYSLRRLSSWWLVLYTYLGNARRCLLSVFYSPCRRDSNLPRDMFTVHRTSAR